MYIIYHYILYNYLYNYIYTYLCKSFISFMYRFSQFFLLISQLQVWGVSVSWGYSLEGTRWARGYGIDGNSKMERCLKTFCFGLENRIECLKIDFWDASFNNSMNTFCCGAEIWINESMDTLDPGSCPASLSTCLCCQVHLHQLACQVARCPVKDTWYNIFIYSTH